MELTRVSRPRGAHTSTHSKPRCLERRHLSMAGMLELSEYRRAIEDHGYSQCCMCLGDCVHGDMLRVLTRCGHSFHDGCIDEWFFRGLHEGRDQPSCPLCRKLIL